MKSQLLILDFGSQYTQLIARVTREIGVFSEIVPGDLSIEKIRKRQPKALILSGGPASILKTNAIQINSSVFSLGIPILGICYGMQIMAHELGGAVAACFDLDNSREFGRIELRIGTAEGPFDHCSQGEIIEVWMSHSDQVIALPPGFKVLASSENAEIAAFCDAQRKFYGFQFHPEVKHTPSGSKLLSNYIFGICKLEKDWNSSHFIEETIEEISQIAPCGNVVCGLSGGVDSTVAAVLVSCAIGSRLFCIFVDNGLLREKEADEVMEQFSELGLQVEKIHAREIFFAALEGITDPEQKRKIIGRVFIDVFEQRAEEITDVRYLVQGTLYPDVIESTSVIGKSETIKSHHNVGGLKEDMKLDLIEPLRKLFKDEVREIGLALGLSDDLIYRQPFPGPGLAVRCIGEITEEKLSILRTTDAILREEVALAGLEGDIWQYFTVLLPIQSVGVMGDSRTYERSVAIRAVTSRDGMTADWFFFPEYVLRRISSRIINETEGINRVVLDISSKPPATIEWE